MGQSFSILGDSRRREDPETVFVVPGHLSLTMRQMEIILSVGQQPGVPFRLGATGAQRPQGNRVKVNYAENLISMQKNSVQLIENDAVIQTVNSAYPGNLGLHSQATYFLNFNYDSLVPSVVKIFIGAKDRTSNLKIRAENASLILGPYQLEVGSNRSWSSKLENSFIEESYFPSRNGSEGLNTEGTGVQTTVPTTPTSDLFDLMICLAPMNMTDRTELFTVMPQSILPSIQQNRGSIMTGSGSIFFQKSNNNNTSDYDNDRNSKAPNYSSNNNKDKTKTSLIDNISNFTTNITTSKTTNKATNKTSSKTDSKNNSTDSNDYNPKAQAFKHPLTVTDLEEERIPDSHLDTKIRKKPSTPEKLGKSNDSVAIGDSIPFPFAPSPYTPYSNSSSTTSSSQPLFSPNSRTIPIHTSDVHLSDKRQSKVICEMSYLKITTPKKPIISASSSVQNVDAIATHYNALEEAKPKEPSGGGALAVKCVMQRVQMPNNVFLTQDVYGMDRNRVEEAESDPAATGTDSPVPTAPTAGMTLDSDAIECVICLTDPREIAVYPCRHMCLCKDCAEVLPSQGNKCPICRRPAAMLLWIHPKGEEMEETEGGEEKRSI